MLATLPAVASLPAQRPAPAPSCPTMRTALVLSGGGARGLAHVGVIEALDSLGIHPDLVVGTSMGALVGSVYASGATPRQLDSLVRVLPLAELFRPNAPAASPADRSLLDPFNPWAPVAVWESGAGGFRLRSPAVREAGVNALLTNMLLAGNIQARGDFSRLPIPYLAVATDLANRDTVVLSRGDLARAVRASIAIPVVFSPIQIDGRILVDGGLSANVPVSVARAAGATRVIVSELRDSTFTDSTAAQSPLAMVTYLVDLLFEQRADSLRPGDIRIVSDVSGIGALDFAPALISKVIRSGRIAADTALRSPEAHPDPTSCAAAPRSKHPADTLGVDMTMFRRRVNAVFASGAFRSIWLRPGASGDTLTFSPIARPAPQRTVSVGISFENQDGARLTVEGRDVGVFGGWVDAGLGFTLGQYDQQVVIRGQTGGITPDVRLDTLLPDPRANASPWNHSLVRAVHAGVIVRADHQLVRRFDSEGNETTSLPVWEAVVFAGVSGAWPNGWFFEVGPYGHWWHQDEVPNAVGANPPSGGELVADPGGRSAFGGLLRAGWAVEVDRASSLSLGASGGSLEVLAATEYQSAVLTLAVPVAIGGFMVRPRAILAAGDDLPAQLTFELGGRESFPGLVLGERRGDRQVFAGLGIAHPIAGPVAIVGDLAAGRIAFGGDLFATDDWVAGAGVGIQVATPLGPARVSWGYASVGRGSIYIRLGY